MSVVAVPLALLKRVKKQQQSQLHKNDPHHHSTMPEPLYEFGGPLGAAAMLIFLPLVIFGLYFACNDKQCISLNPLSDVFLQAESPLKGHTPASFFHTYLYSPAAISVYLSWFALHVVLYFVLPCSQIAEGVALDEKGTKLKYPINGLLSGVVSSSIVILLCYFGFLSPTFAYDHFTQLAFTAAIFSTLLAVGLYLGSLYSSRENGRYLTSVNKLAEHGATGNILYDFFIGRSLNPRLFGLDLKYFCELRPGLVGWMLINMSMACKQYQLHGEITNSMILLNLFQAYYVYDALSSEVAILTTMDITTDGFGWMLAFGDLAWVPFTYSTQTRFLVDHPVRMMWYGIVLVLAVKALGFYIFRGANNQKNVFRTSNGQDESIKHLKYIQTQRGSKLLCSGWWGYSRHMNYVGDLLMGLSWCMPCGVTSIIPYFYFFYFAGLLGHRERRDDAKCREKYGEDWKKYCKIVKYRIVPYVY